MWSRQEQQPVHTMVSGRKRGRGGIEQGCKAAHGDSGEHKLPLAELPQRSPVRLGTVVSAAKTTAWDAAC